MDETPSNLSRNDNPYVHSDGNQRLAGKAFADRTWSWLLGNVILPAGDAAFGQRMLSRLRFLEQAQWWDRERLHAERDRRLSGLMTVAYDQVPYYRQLMDQAGVKPNDIRCPADLSKIPITTKAMLRAGYPHRTTRDTGQRTYESHTSGSTGENFAVLEDAATRGSYLSSFLLSLQWAGWEIGERHLQTGMTLTRNLPRRLKDRLLRCHYVSAFDLDDNHIDRALDIVEQKRIEHLWGYAASLYFFAKRALERGWNRRLRSAVTWGDNLYPHYRETIERAFQVRVLDTYGIGEGTQVSAQCGQGGYHIHTLDVVVEYVDDRGNPVPPDQAGNLILTRLHPGPMPLIRYQVGDVGISGDQAPCPCGRGFDRMQAILGRDTDVVLTPSGNRLIVEFFNGIIDDVPEVDSFQVIQERLDCISVRVVPRAGFTDQTKAGLVSAMKQNGAADLEIHVQCVDEIRLTPGGKRRYVISKLPNPVFPTAASSGM
jgi:phenylacetate-CoA ligase